MSLAVPSNDDRSRVSPTLGPAVRKTLSLPWLELTATFADHAVLAEVERGLHKLAASIGPASTPPLSATFTLSDDPADLRTAGEVWHEPTLRYQFVHGTTSAHRALFATADGTVLDLDISGRTLTAALRASTFSAPYSTWGDLLLAPLTEYWREHCSFPLHAGAVELEDERFLISGFSGSGKTTLCLACLAAGGTWRADDKLLFRASRGTTSAISVYRNTNLHPDTVPHFEGLAFTMDRAPIDETNVKRPCLLEELPVRCDLSAFAPTTLLFPVVSERDTTEVVRLDPRAAMIRLAAQSPLSSHPPRMTSQVKALATLVKQLPAFEVCAGRDVLRHPERAAAALLQAVRGEVRL